MRWRDMKTTHTPTQIILSCNHVLHCIVRNTQSDSFLYFDGGASAEIPKLHTRLNGLTSPFSHGVHVSSPQRHPSNIIIIITTTGTVNNAQ